MEDLSVRGISPVLISWQDTASSPHFHSSDTYGRRLVEHYELEYILSSPSGYILVNDIPIPAVPGSIFIRFPGMAAEGIGVYHSLYIEFDLDAEGRLLLSEGQLGSRCGSGTSCQADEALFYSLKPPEGSLGLAWSLHVKAQILSILSRLAAESPARPEGESAAGQLQKIQSAFRYIHEHYADRITESELAAAAGYSAFYFCRLFKQLTGLTPMQYILRYRAEKARILLISSGDPIEAVMEKTGFHHYSYFWRCFKQIYGDSPSSYRKRFSQNSSY